MAAPGTGTRWRVLIAGGGTGGHLFPGLAIAEALQAQAPGLEVRFVGTPYGIEHRVVPREGYHLYRLPVRGLYAVPWRRRLWVVARLPWALLKCVGILLGYRPHLVLGVGGYASGPMLATALLLRRLTAIQEQNAWPGLTNRLLGPRVHQAFVAMPGLEGLFRKPEVVGNPVRTAIQALRGAAPPRPVPQVLLTGGSQGAHVLNQAMVEALPRLAPLGGRIRILHQTGPRDHAWVQEAYRRHGLDARVVPFVDDMAAAYGESRLVVSRAGSVVNEIVTARRASVLVPIPHSSGDHQRRNALRLAEAGAAVLLEQKGLSGDMLAATLLELLQDPTRLDAMEAATDALYQGDAAERIATRCLALMAERYGG